jgi:NitT/TauT family transport system substrate-binding protein
VAFSAVSPTQGVLWVADVGGLFNKNGFSAEIIYTRAAIETLVAGEVDFAQMTGALMYSARLQGADPVMIAGVQDTLDDRLVARPTIKAMEELKGKRIGVFRFGSASHLRLLYLLPRYGLSERDVTMLQVGDTPERLIALAGGSIDATLVSPPDHFEALRAGMKILLNMRELNALPGAV